MLVGQARFPAALLKGELPSAAGEALQPPGIDLPSNPGELETSCPCPAWANPCKHVAAVHYVVAAALETDPFLIFAVRGLHRESFFAVTAEARGRAVPTSGIPEPAVDEEPQWEPVESMTAAQFLGEGLSRLRLSFRVVPAAVDLAELARQGPPLQALEDLPRRLGPHIRRAARAAPLPDAILHVMEPSGVPFTRREIATLLDRPVDATLRSATKTLRERGQLTMTGARRGARYPRNPGAKSSHRTPATHRHRAGPSPPSPQ